jgi:hypothetical protein
VAKLTSDKYEKMEMLGPKVFAFRDQGNEKKK